MPASIQTPTVWFNPNGIGAYLRSTGISAKNAIECAGRVVGIGGVGTTSVLAIYSPTTGWTRQNLASGGNQICKLLFGAPNGDIFYSLQYNVTYTDTGKLWRIPAGSTTPVQVLDVRASTNWLQSMCADRQGNLYCTEYDTSIGLWKSIDNGANWTKIVSTSFPGSGFTPANHLHVIVYDQYRDVLICSLGDGTNQYNQVSGDGGVTWSSWTLSQQCVAIVPTSKYIFFASDLSTDSGIYRAPVSGTGVSAVTSATPVRVLNPVTDLGLPTQSSFGIAWEGWEDSFGYLVIPRTAVSVSGVAARVLVSPDNGTTWFNFRSWAYAGSGTSDWGQNPAYNAYSSQTGYKYGSINAGSVGPGCMEWRIVPTGWAPRISSSGTNQWAGTGPWAEIPDYACNGNIVPSLSENYATAGYFSRPGGAIRKNGYSFTGTTSTAPIDTNTCDAFPVSGAWTSSASAGPVTTLALDTVQFRVGTGSISMTTAATGGTLFGSIQRNNSYVTNITTNPDVWASMWFRCDTAPSAVWSSILSIENGGVDYVRAQVSSTGVWQVRIRNNATGADDTFDTGVPFLPSSWVFLKLHAVRSSTAGRVRFWINNVLALDLRGLITVGSNNYTDAKYGFSTSQAAVMVFNIDACSLSYADPEQPSGITFSDRTAFALP